LPVLLTILALPLAAPLLRTVRTFSEPRQLNLVLKGTARLALVFGLLFAIGLAVGGIRL
jgi:1,4-dihydroxy-2-naphthoate octaprenyltransferase